MPSFYRLLTGSEKQNNSKIDHLPAVWAEVSATASALADVGCLQCLQCGLRSVRVVRVPAVWAEVSVTASALADVACSVG
ncbi:hypothetical protein ACOMHN_053808 [Nucella lapillus]